MQWLQFRLWVKQWARLSLIWSAGPLCLSLRAEAEEIYFAHPAAADRHGVIAPWYKGQNGQFDFRVRIAAETLKRYPWAVPPKASVPAPEYVYNGQWRINDQGEITVVEESNPADKVGAAMTVRFTGNQVRLIGRVDPSGGLADVYLDGVKQAVPVDFYCPLSLSQQVVYYRNGLSQGPHVLKIVVRGARDFRKKAC